MNLANDCDCSLKLATRTKLKLIMNLIHLGWQSRKTGIKPKGDLAKDKHDMEDVDAFFSESTWLVSRAWSLSERSDARLQSEQKEEKTQSTLHRYPHESDITAMMGAHTNVKHTSSSKSLFQSYFMSHSIDSVEPYEVQQGTDYDDFHPFIHDNTSGAQVKILGFPSSDITEGKIQGRHSHIQSGNSQSSKRARPNTQTRQEVTQITKRVALEQSNEMASFEKPIDFLLSNDESFSGVPTGESGPDVSRIKKSNPSSQRHFRKNMSLPSPTPEGLRRSKRTKIAPLAYWRNERIIYTRAREISSDPHSTLMCDIQKIPLQEIVEVIHVPEQNVRDKSSKRTKRLPPTHEMEGKDELIDGSCKYNSDPEIMGSEWFKHKSLRIDVFENDEQMTSRIVAWAPDGGNFKMPPQNQDGQLAGENFMVASLFDANLNVIASGLLDFPIEGFKSLRNTGESQFIFHVAKGLIEVTLNSNKFVVTRGCSFEVPRYNIYSMKNLGDGHARVFFVQSQISAVQLQHP